LGKDAVSSMEYLSTKRYRMRKKGCAHVKKKRGKRQKEPDLREKREE